VVQLTLDNTPPQVGHHLSASRANHQRRAEPQVALQAQASDPFLTKVDFYIDDVLVGDQAWRPSGSLDCQDRQAYIKLWQTIRPGHDRNLTNFTVGK